MKEQFDRSAMILGESAIELLHKKHVAVFGIGGVGSFSAEALVRAGIGSISLFDADCVDITNLNRQLIALHSTVGRAKVEVAAERARDINPDVNVFPNKIFYGEGNADEFDLAQYDYIIDAIDTVSSKLILIERAQAAGVPIISSMGTGNKLDPTQFKVTDIYKTSGCPLAKVMRYELKRRGIKKLKVLYSEEQPIKPLKKAENSPPGRNSPGSVSFVPSVAGLILAGEVIKELLK
ncbi:MAG: tRNA threonylcarbamoyladenosine dehydratase, partial [Oscillospiraceae bacterium]|nr:tRNA threonylcarbamoyladenosine dehydratase [Oscillospiraceae bacterium]